MCERDLFKVGDKVKYVDDELGHFYGEVLDPCVQIHVHSRNYAVTVKVAWFHEKTTLNVTFFLSNVKSQDQLEPVAIGEFEAFEVMAL